MEQDKMQDQGCDSCQQDFEQNIDNIVNEVDDYTEQDHMNKEKEVDEAFQSSDYQSPEDVIKGGCGCER